MKTSHFEGRIALSAADAAQARDERTQRELTAFDFDFGSAWLVPPAGDGRKISAAGKIKTGHFDPRLGF